MFGKSWEMIKRGMAVALSVSLLAGAMSVSSSLPTAAASTKRVEVGTKGNVTINLNGREVWQAAADAMQKAQPVTGDIADRIMAQTGSNGNPVVLEDDIYKMELPAKALKGLPTGLGMEMYISAGAEDVAEDYTAAEEEEAAAVVAEVASASNMGATGVAEKPVRDFFASSMFSLIKENDEAAPAGGAAAAGGEGYELNGSEHIYFVLSNATDQDVNYTVKLGDLEILKTKVLKSHGDTTGVIGASVSDLIGVPASTSNMVRATESDMATASNLMEEAELTDDVVAKVVRTTLKNFFIIYRSEETALGTKAMVVTTADMKFKPKDGGVFPERGDKMTLAVRDITDENELQGVANTLAENNVDHDKFAAVDISFRKGGDSKDYEPCQGQIVNVRIETKAMEGFDPETMSIQHHLDNGEVETVAGTTKKTRIDLTDDAEALADGTVTVTEDAQTEITVESDNDGNAYTFDEDANKAAMEAQLSAAGKSDFKMELGDGETPLDNDTGEKSVGKAPAAKKAPKQDVTKNDVNRTVSTAVNEFGVKTETETETAPNGNIKVEEGKVVADFIVDSFSIYTIVGQNIVTVDYLSADGNTYTVSVDLSDANIPEGAYLQVEELSADEAEEYIKEAAKAVDTKVKDLLYSKALDISIIYNNEKIQPDGNVRVEVTLQDKKKDIITEVVHFGDETEVLDSETDGKTVDFTTDGFSVFAIVGTELKKEITLTTPDGEDVTYVVSVTYGPEAEIPEGASLELNVVDEDTKTYKDVKDLLFSDGAEDIAEEGQNPELLLTDDSGEVPVYTYSTSDGIIRELDSQRALDVLDISIRNEEGEIVEPKDSVKVSIVMKEAPEEMTLQEIASSAVVQHLNEKSGNVVIETVATGDNSVDGTVQAIGNEVKAVFEVDSFSLYTFSYTSYGTTVSQRVHYVDENGRELPAPAVTPSQNNGHSHLIYDIDGYEYVRTTISSASGTQISPYIQAEWTGYGYNQSLRWRYRTLTINANGNRTLGNWQNLTQDVYVVYRQKPTPPQGGDSVPVVPQGEWPEFPNGEKTKPTKTSVDNGDGTSTLSLTVTGAETPLTSGKVKAQVIVVFDLSGSMNYRMGSDTNPGYGERSRLSYSKEAVESLTNALGTNDKLDVEMALVTFSNYARTAMGFTNVSSATGRQSFISTVDGLSATGGTNWEAALREANYIQTKSDAKTYVIFVSDGAPTFRVSRGSYSESNINGNVNDDNDYYMSYGIFGTGSATHTEDRSFALTQATSIVNSNKTFYTVALTDANDTGHASEYMEDLNTRAGGAGNFSATSPEELADVINAIGTSITTELGFADISIHDGITELTNLNAKVLQSVDENSFKYYRYGGENNKYGTESNPTTWGNDPSDSSKLEGGANKATYDSNTGAVEWNMGSGFQLEDGVTYKVSFKVWPDQDAYDWIAKLRNGTVQYADLPADVKAQIDEATLSLKTNTDAYVRYKKSSTTSGDTTTTGDPIQVDYNTVDPMPLPAQSIPIEKIFINELDPERYKNEPVRISLTGGGDTFAVVNLDDSNSFKTSAFISYGLMTPGDEPVLKEPGHDFVLTELSAYHWDLEAGVYRPMIIGGERKLLQKVDSGGDYTIDGKQYKELADGASISATNYRRSNLNLTKNIVDKDGQTSINDKYPNQLFEYTITVNSSDGEDVWFSVQTDPDDYTTVVTDLTTSAHPEVDDEGNPKNNGYFYQQSGESFTVSLKPTWNLRFTNLPKGSSYTIVETSTEGFEFSSASLNPAGDDEQFTVTKSTATVTGVVAEYSKQYQITYTNRCTMLDIVVIKTDDAGTSIPGATFNLLKKDGNSYQAIPNRDDLVNFSIPVDGIKLTGLLPGDYKLEEVTPPDGYIIIKKETYFNLSDSDEVIKLSDESKDIASTSGEKRDTVSIKNQPGQELPLTGGPGTLPYTLGGFILMISALMYGFMMRRRERRLM